MQNIIYDRPGRRDKILINDDTARTIYNSCADDCGPGMATNRQPEEDVERFRRCRIRLGISPDGHGIWKKKGGANSSCTAAE